jgi:hypothetical protein
MSLNPLHVTYGQIIMDACVQTATAEEVLLLIKHFCQ